MSFSLCTSISKTVSSKWVIDSFNFFNFLRFFPLCPLELIYKYKYSFAFLNFFYHKHKSKFQFLSASIPPFTIPNKFPLNWPRKGRFEIWRGPNLERQLYFKALILKIKQKWTQSQESFPLTKIIRILWLR